MAHSLEVKRKYREANRENLAAQERARHHAKKHDPEYVKNNAERRSKNRVKMREWSVKRSFELDDGYVREMLSKYSTISAKDWPQELVDAKRAELALMRLTGDKRYKPISEEMVEKIIKTK